MEQRERVSQTTLENGVRIVTETVPGTRSVSIGVLVDCGPGDERAEQAGLAHFSEHLLFQGTSSRSALEIGRFIDSAGGRVGGFTARDYTCYYATVLGDYCYHALDLFGDMLLNSTFPPEAVRTEKSAILGELGSARDNPPTRVQQLLRHKVWPEHYLGRPIEGTAKSVSGLDREDAIYFVHRNYTPDRIVIAAAGRVQHDDFTAQVRDSFWRLMGKRPPSAERNSAEPVAGVCVEQADTTQSYFSLGIPTVAYDSEDRYSLHVLVNILGGGISSRLFRTLREEHGLVYEVQAEYLPYREGGLVEVSGSAPPGQLLEVTRIVQEELDGMATWRKPISDEELTLSQTQIQGGHCIAGEETQTRMSRLATQELYFGRHIPDQEILDRIGAVGIADLRDRAQELLGNALERSALVLLGPGSVARQRSEFEGLFSGQGLSGISTARTGSSDVSAGPGGAMDPMNLVESLVAV